MPLACMILPVDVILNRRLAPLWVLSLTLLPISWLFLSLLAATRLGSKRSHMHCHGATLHTRRLLDGAVLTKLLLKLIEQITSKLRMRDGSPAEEDAQFYLVAPIEKLRSLSSLGFQVVVANLWLDPDFLETNHMLGLAGITLFPTLLVPEFSVIHQATDGRDGVGSDLYEIETTLAGHLQRISRLDDTYLVSLIINESYLADANSFVYASLNWSRNSLPPELLAMHVGHAKKPVQKTDVSPATTPYKDTIPPLRFQLKRDARYL